MPGFALEVALKKTNAQLKRLTHIDMLLMHEKGIRGGLSQAVHRYASANTKYMPNYDSSRVSSYLMYLDANNLYGWAMCKKLPIGGYTWSNNHDRCTSEFIKKYDENSNLGYLFEVDVEYPQHLHELHSDLPFLTEKKQKLLATLNNEKNYVVHILALKQALNHGLILKKIHRVIRFRQEAWLKPYIDKKY